MNTSTDDAEKIDSYANIELVFASWTTLTHNEEPSQYLCTHGGQLISTDWDGEKETHLGDFTVCLIDLDAALNDSVAAHDVFDSQYQTYDVWQSLYDPKTAELKKYVERLAFGNDYVTRGNILLIDRIVVEPAHRGNGVGLLAIHALLRQFRSFAGLAVMKPFPLQFEGTQSPMVIDSSQESALPTSGKDSHVFQEGEEVATTKLKRYYSKLGFKAVPRTRYMVRSCDLPLPVLP